MAPSGSEAPRDGASNGTTKADKLAQTVVKKARRRRQFFEENGKFSGWSTGFQQLDELTGGFPRPGLYLLSGRPGIGKTTVAAYISANVAQEIPVVYLTFENRPISLVEKILCAGGPRGTSQTNAVSLNRLRRGLCSEEKIDMIGRRAEEFEWLRNLHVLGPTSDLPEKSESEKWTAGRLEKTVRKTVDDAKQSESLTPGLGDEYSRPACLVVVDYLQHWAKRNPDYDDLQATRERVERMGSRLASLGSEECPTAVLAVASQNRRGYVGSGEQSGRFRSSLSSLKESGDLEYMADVAMFLVPDGELQGDDDIRRLTLEVLKNRHGQTGNVDLRLRADTSQVWQG